jgi:hypothetical protein
MFVSVNFFSAASRLLVSDRIRSPRLMTCLVSVKLRSRIDDCQMQLTGNLLVPQLPPSVCQYVPPLQEIRLFMRGKRTSMTNYELCFLLGCDNTLVILPLYSLSTALVIICVLAATDSPEHQRFHFDARV